MAGNPLVQQGTLNRIRGSVIVPGFTNLNVTASYLGKMGIRLGLEGNATTLIDTMTGMVTSPEPYLPANVTIHLLRTQNLGALWRSQMEGQTSAIGAITVIPDSIAWPQFDFANCGITSIGEQPFDGSDPGYVITLRGTYAINAGMFNLTQ